MDCLNISLPSIKKNLQDLTNIVGNKDVAYAVLASNNGYSMQQTDIGKESLLYNDLLNITNDEDKAAILKMRTYAPSFKTLFGSGNNKGIVDTQGEPKLFSRKDNFYFIGIDDKKIPLANTEITPSLYSKKGKKLAIDDISEDNINNILTRQYKVNPDDNLKPGSFVEYTKAGGTGVSNMMVYRNNLNGTVNAFNLDTLTSDHIGIVSGISTKRFKKLGDFNVTSPLDPNIPNKKSIVLPKSKKRSEIIIVNITDKATINKQAANIQRGYINDAVEGVLLEEYNKTAKVEIEDTSQQLPFKSTSPYTEKDNVFVHAETDAELQLVLNDLAQDIAAGVSTFFVVPTELANGPDRDIGEYFYKLGWQYKTKEGLAYFTKPKATIPVVEQGLELQSKQSTDPNNVTMFNPPVKDGVTVTDSKGQVHIEGSVAGNSVLFMKDLGLDAVPYLKQDNKTAVGKALQTAIPGAYTFEYNTIEDIRWANDYLKENIATDPNDPRIKTRTGGTDINVYNALVYDIYQETLHRALTVNTPTFNPEIAFNLRVEHVKSKLKSDIKSLEIKKLNLQNLGKSTKEISAVEQAIDEKSKTLGLIDDEYTVETVKNIAERDLKRIAKIVNRSNISPDELNRANQTLKTWRLAGDFSNVNNNIFLDEATAASPAIQDDFRDIATRAETLQNKLDEKGKNLLTSRISASLNKVFNYPDLIKLKNKISGWFKTVYSVAKIDNPIIAYIMKTINDANKRAEIKAITESNDLADLYRNLEKRDFDFELFWQKDKDGTITGNLISEYTSEYLKNMGLFERGVQNKRINMRYYKADNVFINMNILAGASEQTKQDYITEISKLIGYEKAVTAVEQAEEQFQLYLEVKDNFLMAEFGKTEAELEPGSQEEIDFINWKRLNSPAARVKSIEQAGPNASYASLEGVLGARFTVVVPKKFDETGDPTGLYDEAFNEIAQDEDAAAFYETAFRITQKAQANFNISGMSKYALASIKNTSMEEFNQRGIKEFTTQTVWDKTVGYLAGKEPKQEIKDPVTKEVVKVLDKGVQTIDALINKEVYKIREDKGYTRATIRGLSPEEHAAIYKQASDTVMKTSSKDIFKALNALNTASLGYGFKAAIKPEIDMALHYLDQLEAGDSTETLLASTVKEQDVANAKEMIDFFIDRAFFDLGNIDNSLKLPITLYTTEERKRKKQLIKQLKDINDPNTPSKGESTRLRVETELKTLGRKATLNSTLKAIMDLLRVSTMGWNMQAAIANLGQGQIVNLIHAAEGKMYTRKNLYQAYSALFNDRTKFDNIIKNYALLGDIMYNFERKTPFEKKKGFLGRAKKLINPFEGTRITEKLNQGNVMIAMMMHLQLDGPDGKISLWDAIDQDGRLSDKYSLPTIEGVKAKTGNDAVAEAVVTMREQINIIQGDYTNPKKINETILGRAGAMFKLWFFDPFQARFGSRQYNYILEREVRGRYLSAGELVFQYGVNYKQFQQDKRDGKISEVDINNARVTLMELSAIMATGLISLFAKAVLCNDEKSKCGGVASTYIVNSLDRINNEVSTFLNPKQYYDFISNPVAVARYLQTLMRLADYMAKAAAGEDMDNRDGHNKILVAAGKELPFLRRLILGRDLMENVRQY